MAESAPAEMAAELSKQTKELISRFESRASAFSKRPDLAELTRHVDPGRADDFARSFFGEGEHTATGIDGSMDFDERLQMILFYSNASAYTCPFSVDATVSFDLDSAWRDSSLGASAAVPLWAEDLSSVFSGEPEIDIDLEHSLERIPNSFMTLGELYLAHRACEKSKVIFLDRPMSGTYSTLSRDARLLLQVGEIRLAKWRDGGAAAKLDLELALRMGAPDLPIPRRSRYLTQRVVAALHDEAATTERLALKAGATEPSVRKALKKLELIDKAYGGALLSEASGRYSLREEAKSYWERAERICLDYAGDVFSKGRHPLALAGEEYLTVLDVNAAALILLQATCLRSRMRQALLVGIAKDTTATDISRAVLPYAVASGSVKLDSAPPRLKSDRAFLAILSSENPSISTPWRTLAYDGAFSTIVEKKGRLIGARKVVSREELFARSYFQLRTLRTDDSVRSQVFLFDRPFDAPRDSEFVREVKVEERSGPTVVDAYFEGERGSDLSNLALRILSLCDNPEVFEAFGHNQLLYLADKAVKTEVRMLRSSLRGVADLRVGGVSTRRKVFGLATTYRQQRAEAEHARMRR